MTASMEESRVQQLAEARACCLLAQLVSSFCPLVSLREIASRPEIKIRKQLGKLSVPFGNLFDFYIGKKVFILFSRRGFIIRGSYMKFVVIFVICVMFFSRGKVLEN